MAHEQDITFNQCVEQALRLQAEKDIKEMKERLQVEKITEELGKQEESTSEEE